MVSTVDGNRWTWLWILFVFVFMTCKAAASIQYQHVNATVVSKTNNRDFWYPNKPPKDDEQHQLQDPTKDKKLNGGWSPTDVNGGGTRWANAELEAMDEQRDAEIFEAVLQSMAEWSQRKRRNNNDRNKRKDAGKSRPKRGSSARALVTSNDYELDREVNSNKVTKDEPSTSSESSKVCFGEELGCFEEAGYIDMLPNSPSEVNTRFLLYNSRKSKRGETPLLDVGASNMSSAETWQWVSKAFNVSASTKVIIHGFGSSCSNVWVYEMRSALMSVEECNVICVDWEAGATIPNYVRAAANTRLVGKQVAILLRSLQKHCNISLGKVHLIGFSLGAHVAGFAGSELGNLSRITGLDPAGPLFESQDRRARLDSLDAQFVDVIHSNGENLILGGLGAWQPMGHVDFYPNGGRMQKGCSNLFVGAVSDMIWSANEVYGRSLCNHRRAYKFFTDSVSHRCQFPAVPCSSYEHFLDGKCFPCSDPNKCSNMGYYADQFQGRGILYLVTRDEEPFCANQYMIKLENDRTASRMVVLSNATANEKSDTEISNSTPQAPKATSSTPVSHSTQSFGRISITLIGDLDINETFYMTQKKDDKLKLGEPLMRIIVPHPALTWTQLRSVQICYTAYNGWISSGTPTWTVDRLSITDSHGRQMISSCDQQNDDSSIILASGVPTTLSLFPAEQCSTINPTSAFNLETVNTAVFTELMSKGNQISTERTNESTTNGVKRSLEVTMTNNHFTSMEQNKQKATQAEHPSMIGVAVTEYYYNLTSHNDKEDTRDIDYDWLLTGITGNEDTGRDLKDDGEDSSQFTGRKKNKEDEPYEFVTDKPLPAKQTEAHTPQDRTTEISEPILKPKTSTRPTVARGKSIKMGDARREFGRQMSPKSVDKGYVNTTMRRSDTNATDTTTTKPQIRFVQFLPHKLVSFFEQAEKYARTAFSAPYLLFANIDNDRQSTADKSNSTEKAPFNSKNATMVVVPAIVQGWRRQRTSSGTKRNTEEDLGEAESNSLASSFMQSVYYPSTNANPSRRPLMMSESGQKLIAFDYYQSTSATSSPRYIPFIVTPNQMNQTSAVS